MGIIKSLKMNIYNPFIKKGFTIIHLFDKLILTKFKKFC
jgi:hypothetical protein